MLLVFFSSCISNRLAGFVLPDSGRLGQGRKAEILCLQLAREMSERLPHAWAGPPLAKPLSPKSSMETTEPPVLLGLGLGRSLS